MYLEFLCYIVPYNGISYHLLVGCRRSNNLTVPSPHPATRRDLLAESDVKLVTQLPASVGIS